MRFTLLLLASAAVLMAADPRVPIEDARARVVMASNTPGQKSRMHKHTMNRVMVYLDSGSMRIAPEAGPPNDFSFQPGTVRWDPAGGLHTSENTSSESIHIAEIELRQPGQPVQFPALDPVKVDPKHYHIEFENPQVRVVKARYGPGESSPVHEHALPRIIIPITDVSMKVTQPDGTVRDFLAKAGQVSQGGKAKHSEVNSLQTPVEIVIVELKMP